MNTHKADGAKIAAYLAGELRALADGIEAGRIMVNRVDVQDKHGLTYHHPDEIRWDATHPMVEDRGYTDRHMAISMRMFTGASPPKLKRRLWWRR